MDIATNITASVSSATIKKIGDSIDRKGGMLAKAQAAKNLSNILLSEFAGNFDPNKAQPGTTAYDRLFPVSLGLLETLTWLVSELWEVNQDLAGMVDTLIDDYGEVSDAGYRAEKAARPCQKAGA